MTTVISSIVSDVSATFVDRTTLRKPEGGLPIQGVVGGAIARWAHLGSMTKPRVAHLGSLTKPRVPHLGSAC